MTLDELFLEISFPRLALSNGLLECKSVHLWLNLRMFCKMKSSWKKHLSTKIKKIVSPLSFAFSPKIHINIIRTKRLGGLQNHTRSRTHAFTHSRIHANACANWHLYQKFLLTNSSASSLRRRSKDASGGVK
jgi:hypothetical protein